MHSACRCTLSLSKGALSGLGPDRLGGSSQGSTLDGTDEGGGAKFSESPRSGRAARESEREIGEAAAARGDSEKTSAISACWEKLPS